MSDAPAYLTPYGFQFGAIDVVRACELPNGRVVVTAKTPHRELNIYASRTGRSLRVFEKDGGELLEQGMGQRPNDQPTLGGE